MHEATLVTGATGFLGSNLVRALVRDGYSVVALKRTTSSLGRLRDVQDQLRFYDLDSVPLSRVFEENHFSQIIHCATNYGRRTDKPWDVIQTNLILPLQLLEMAQRFSVPKFYNTDTVLDKGVNAYTLSKKQFLEWLRKFGGEMLCLNISLEHFYGPIDDRSKFVSKIVLDLLASVEEIPLTLGEQRRDFIYIDDVVKAFLKILEFGNTASRGYYSFEVGSGQSIAIRDFVEMAKGLCQNSKTKLNFGALPYREKEIMDSAVNIAPLRELGWLPEVGLEEGLMRTISGERRALDL
jgi:CDP-paratose synthetase